MTQAFHLKRAREITPSCGEELGGALARFAESEIARIAVPHNCNWIAQTLYLAAEAFERGASASIGHNRSDRYHERADELRAMAERLEAQAEVERADAESARLLVAFDDGFAGRDIKRHSFENREAAVIGQLFAKEGREMPTRINKVYAPRPLGRDSVRDYLQVDDLKFVVDYPDGKIADAVASQIK